MQKSPFHIVITGHIDHGKSSLIGSLLVAGNSVPESKLTEVKLECETLGKPFEFAYLLDYLAEERSKGITIDTTQIPFKSSQREYMIIDAPGHKEFIKNMITGAAEAEAAILIVDVERGLEEQTKRHAFVLSLLGINRVIVVINKMDLVDYGEQSFERLRESSENLCHELGLEIVATIPVSARESQNINTVSEKMPWFQGKAVLDTLDLVASKTELADRPLVLPIQDFYAFLPEPLYVGRVEAGLVKKGLAYQVLPEGKKVKLKNLKVFEKEIDSAKQGENVAFEIEGDGKLQRGEIISDRDLPVAKELNANIFCMTEEGLNPDGNYTLSLFTQKSAFQFKKINYRVDTSSLQRLPADDTIKHTELANVSLNLANKIVLEEDRASRFTIEKEGEIVAFGIISN
ncbi:MAG: GTP-binding protein [Candidatus Gracilibacteria bacterium]|nr:GTP-binding protein [Candidatus Gracilibacteria bacterium]